MNINYNTVVYGHVGRIKKKKNHYFLIKIFNEILKLHKDSILLLVGEGKLRPKIQELVKEYKIEDNVRFLGIRRDTDRLYSAMDIFLLPSLYEGFPVTLLEAQASGLNIFCSDTISKEVNVTDNIHFLPLKENEKEWAINIYNAKTNYNREDQYKKLYTKKCDAKTNARRLEDVYLQNIEKLGIDCK